MGNLIKKINCNNCGSSDANAIYNDGSSHCYSCENHVFGDNTITTTKDTVKSNNNIKSNLNGKYIDIIDRKISKWTCEFTKYQVLNDKHICIYNDNGQKIRYPNKDFNIIGSLNGELYLQHKWNKLNYDSIIITEGEIDTLSIIEVTSGRQPVVSLNGGSKSTNKNIKNNIDFLLQYDIIILGFDNDKQGLEATNEAIKLLPVEKVKVINWGAYKDANEVLVNNDDRNILINDYINKAEVKTPNGIIDKNNYSFDKLMINRNNKSYHSKLYPELSEKLGGFRKQELTIFTAGSGIGKSTIVTEIGKELLCDHNLNILHIGLEESVQKTIFNYMAIDMNINKGELFLNYESMDKDKLEKSYNYIMSNNNFYTYDSFGSLDFEELLNTMRYMVNIKKVDFILLDHITIIVSGMESDNERQAIDIMMTKLRMFIEETGVGVIAISHLSNSTGKKTHETGESVQLSQLRGSGGIKQISDNVIALERDQQHKTDGNITNIRLLKNRLLGQLGLCDKLNYNNNTGRLLIDGYVDPSKSYAIVNGKQVELIEYVESVDKPKLPLLVF